MKLYRVEMHHENVPKLVYWTGTLADAKAAHKDARSNPDIISVEPIKAIDVPTDKPGLLDWLNNSQAGGTPLVRPEPDERECMTPDKCKRENACHYKTLCSELNLENDNA